ncbi:MAG: trypsin-like peptidase domain-containing protein [Thermoleophilia bacterium]|nr:trypsin-like peptidase domain-containing protein [Thermoleophilia bacterium]
MPSLPRLAVLPAALAAAAPAAAAVDDTPLDRGSAQALASVYRVQVRYEMDGLRVGGTGRVIPLQEGARVVEEMGTAFAVSPHGYLVTAAHVAAPDGAALARYAAPAALAARRGGGGPVDQAYVRDWVALNDVRPVNARLTELRVLQATPDGAGRPVSWPAAIVAGGRSAVDDLVLLRIPARGVPALELDESMTTGTPVSTIGFGTPDPLAVAGTGPAVPAIRPGTLGATGRVAAVPGQRFTVVTAPVEQGDSGGPAVDAAGRVHGVVRWRYRGGGVLVRAARVRALLTRVGVAADAGPSAAAFRSGLQRLWRADLAGAAADLRAAQAAYPRHALAGPEIARVGRLRDGGPAVRAPSWDRELWLALATAFLLAAAGCLAGAFPRRLRRVPPGGAERGLHASRGRR